MFEATIDAGATVINIPDTLGYMQPPEFADMVKYVIENVPNIDKAAVSVHCHNDLGMATALSLAAVRVGAEWVECTVNGVGERAGNASLEEIVMGLKTRPDFFQAETGVKTDQIWRTSRMVSSYMGFPVQPNKAIVGSNAFSHASGLHQDGMLKERSTYEIMTPESIGRSDSRIVISKHSGRNAFRDRLTKLGYHLDDEEFMRAFRSFKEIADRKKEVTDGDIEAVVADQVLTVEEAFKLVTVPGHVRRSRRSDCHRAGHLAGRRDPYRCCDWRWSSGRRVPGDQSYRRHRDEALGLQCQRRGQRHRRAGRSLGARRVGRGIVHRPWNEHRHRRRVRACLCQCAEQDRQLAQRRHHPDCERECEPGRRHCGSAGR